MNFCRLTIQEPIFSVSNAEFEGGDDGHGYGDCIFLAKQAQPSAITVFQGRDDGRGYRDMCNIAGGSRTDQPH
jgi:hypothetical protein